MPFWNTLGKEAAGAAPSIISAGLGLMLEKHNDARQLRQQQDLTDIQTRANKNLAEFNYQQQLKLWEATNYDAQKKQMEKAGLNPALLYGLSSGGGATANAAQAGSASGGSAASNSGEIMGMLSQKMQLQLLQSQIELNKSSANKNNAEATKTGGVDTQKAGAEIEKLKQDTRTSAAHEQLTISQNKIAEAEGEVKQASIENAIALVRLQMQNEDQKWNEQVRNNSIGNETRETIIKTIQQEYMKLLLEKAMIQQNITESGSRVALNEAEITNMAKQISLGWANWENNARTATTGERGQKQNEFINNVQESTKLPLDMIEKIIQAVTLGNFKK